LNLRHDGKVMKEWLSLHPKSGVNWLFLAEEASDFAGSLTGPD
jgi:hypothetical protein